jgi:hypothetical protein
LLWRIRANSGAALHCKKLIMVSEHPVRSVTMMRAIVQDVYGDADEVFLGTVGLCSCFLASALPP